MFKPLMSANVRSTERKSASVKSSVTGFPVKRGCAGRRIGRRRRWAPPCAWRCCASGRPCAGPPALRGDASNALIGSAAASDRWAAARSRRSSATGVIEDDLQVLFAVLRRDDAITGRTVQIHHHARGGRHACRRHVHRRDRTAADDDVGRRL